MNSYTNYQLNFLLDKNVDEGGRDDIAMDLAYSDNVLAFETLFTVASDETDNQLVRNSCVESMAAILYRNKYEKKYLNSIGVDRINAALNLIKKMGFNLYEELSLRDIDIEGKLKNN